MSIFNRLRTYHSDWKSSGQGLPISCEVIGSKGGGMFLIAIGIFFLLTPLQLVIAAAPDASQEASAISSHSWVVGPKHGERSLEGTPGSTRASTDSVSDHSLGVCIIGASTFPLLPTPTIVPLIGD